MAGRGRGRGIPPQQIPVPLNLDVDLDPAPQQPAGVQPTPGVIAEALSSVTIGPGRGRGRGHLQPPATIIGLNEPTQSTLQLDAAARGRGAVMLPNMPLAGSMIRAPAISGSEIPSYQPAGVEPVPAQEPNTAPEAQPRITPGRGRGVSRAAPTPAPVPGLQPEPVPADVLPPASTVSTTLGISTAAGTPGSGSNLSASGGAVVSSSQSGVSPVVSSHAGATVGGRSSTVPAAEGNAASEVQAQVEQQAVVIRESQVERNTEPKSFRGEKGDQVKLMYNFLRIRIETDYGLYEYVATFEPHLEETRMRKTVMNTLAADLSTIWTFDGRKLYLPVQLLDTQLCFTTTDPNDPSKTMTVKLTKVDTTAEAKIQFYNVLIRKLMLAMNYTEINRDFYNPAKVFVVAQHNLEVWPGYITAIEQYEGGLMLCLNSTCRVMRRDTVLEMLTQVRQRNPGGYRKAFMEMIVDKAVLTRYNNKHYQIHDVDWDQNPTHTFEKKGQQVMYSEYFMAQHGKEIRNLSQPLLISRIKRRKNDPRGEHYYVSLIPELCYQSGLTDDMRANQMLMRDLIAHSRSTPMQRHASITEFLASLKDSEKAQGLMGPWGFGFERECVIDVGRQTQGPTLQFSAFSMKSANADFGREATTNKCFNPVSLKHWIVFCTNQDKEKADKMLIQYRQVVSPLGINFGPQPQITFLTSSSGRMPSAADIRQALRTAVANNQSFVMVILPVAKDDLYAAVKRFCLVENPMPSQVILGKTLSQDKKLRAVMQKVALQINCKLGGSLWALNIPLKDLIMFVGIDAHHDPSRKKKSVLALVASLNNHCTEYYSRIVNQGPHQESGDAISPVFNQALQAFYVANSRYPDRIVFFRDGVGDGMLKSIKTTELTELKRVVEMTCTTKPKLLFVVVQKRINERMFLIKPGRQLDNPNPGTIVDHTITRLGIYDFFLVSQLVRQGTVGPSHFVVLEDSGEGKPDLVQRFAYVTSYMYYNWPGSVRVPAMCQYAHKLAMLVGQHLDTEPKDMMERQLYYL